MTTHEQGAFKAKSQAFRTDRGDRRVRPAIHRSRKAGHDPAGRLSFAGRDRATAGRRLVRTSPQRHARDTGRYHCDSPCLTNIGRCGACGRRIRRFCGRPGRGTVRVGAVTGAAVGYLVPAIHALKRETEGTLVSIQVAPSVNLNGKLAERRSRFCAVSHSARRRCEPSRHRARTKRVPKVRRAVGTSTARPARAANRRAG